MRVMIIGSKGKMGQETVKAVMNASDLTLVAQVDRGDDLDAILNETKPDVAVDFTHPSCVKQNTVALLEHGVYPVVGTTGLSAEDLNEVHALASEKKLAVFVVPNFAIGAVLMMMFSEKAAKYMDRAEIIEFHHDQKADAPSGTSIKTADLMAQANPQLNAVTLDEKEIVPGARGGNYKNIPIHSVRLPGFVAHQEVIFGGKGQRLTLRHDSIDRACFMPGVILAIRKVKELSGVVYGLENIL